MQFQIPVNCKCNHTVALDVGKMLLLNVLDWEAIVVLSITVTDEILKCRGATGCGML